MAQLDHPSSYGEGYYTLDVPLRGLPAKLGLAGTTYEVKPEFHCSLIAVKLIVPQIMERDGLSAAEAESKVTQAAIQIMNDIQPKIVSFGPEFRIADQPERSRRTVILLVEVSGLEEVFVRLNRELGLTVPTQAPHITLFALGGLPIGLPSAADMARWTRSLTAEEDQQLHLQINVPSVFGVTL